MRRHLCGGCTQLEPCSGIGEAGAQKLTRVSYDTLVYDATLRKFIDDGWRHAREPQPH